MSDVTLIATEVPEDAALLGRVPVEFGSLHS